MINEQALATFIEVAQCDRRTAAWCMSRFRNNMSIALAFYFDMPRIDIPEDFNPDSVIDQGLPQLVHELPPPTQTATQPRPPDVPVTTVPPPPPPPPPSLTASLDTNDIVAFKFSASCNQQPTLFVPLGQVQFQPPNLPESLWEDAEHARAETERSIFADVDAETVSCVVWRNGISWGDHFFDETADGYSEAIRQLEMNQLPTALIPDIQLGDVDLVFRKTASFEFNP